MKTRILVVLIAALILYAAYKLIPLLILAYALHRTLF